MGVIKQMHINCTPGNCCAPAEFRYTCYAGRTNGADIDPTEPPESTQDSDRDPNIDMDRD